VTSGDGAGTYFMASPNVTTVSQPGTDPVHWLMDKSTPKVTLQIDSNVTTIDNPINVVANGSGETKIESLGTAVKFTGNVTLLDLNPGVQESKNLTLSAPVTSTGNGMWFSGVIGEQDGGGGVTDDILKLIIRNNSSNSSSTPADTVTLTGSNTYSGGTDVDSGTLRVNNAAASATGSGDVNVSFYGTFGATDNGTARIGGNLTVNGTLSGNGTIAPEAGKNILINNGGQVIVGADATGSAKSMSIIMSGGTFTLDNKIVLDIFARENGITSTEADRLIFGGTGTIDLTSFALLKVNTSLDSVNNFVVGDSWRLIDWGTVSLTRSPTDYFFGLDPTANGGYTNDSSLPDLNLGLGYTWDISQLYTLGTITVAVPEPGRLGLLLLGILALFGRRRRRW